jgi:hypothetical protein
MNEGRGEYKRTVSDRQGPKAAHFLQTVRSLIIPIVAGAFIGGALAAQRGFSAALIVLSALGGSLTFAVWWWYFKPARRPLPQHEDDHAAPDSDSSARSGCNATSDSAARG